MAETAAQGGIDLLIVEKTPLRIVDLHNFGVYVILTSNHSENWRTV